jgi:hypothetical protein
VTTIFLQPQNTQTAVGHATTTVQLVTRSPSFTGPIYRHEGAMKQVEAGQCSCSSRSSAAESPQTQAAHPTVAARPSGNSSFVLGDAVSSAILTSLFKVDVTERFASYCHQISKLVQCSGCTKKNGLCCDNFGRMSLSFIYCYRHRDQRPRQVSVTSHRTKGLVPR